MHGGAESRHGVDSRPELSKVPSGERQWSLDVLADAGFGLEGTLGEQARWDHEREQQAEEPTHRDIPSSSHDSGLPLPISPCPFACEEKASLYYTSRCLPERS